MSHSSFYRQGHQFRNDISLLYSSIIKIVKDAYGDEFTKSFTWNYSGGPVGYLSNMTVVYVWTLFENLMRNAYSYTFVNTGKSPTDDAIRKNNRGWGQMNEWLTSKDLLINSPSDNLNKFEPMIGELDARRNCLVHNNGIVDQQYKQQVNKYRGKNYFELDRAIWTDWKYHEQLKEKLISFQMLLEARLEKYISSIKNDI